MGGPGSGRKKGSGGGKRQIRIVPIKKNAIKMTKETRRSNVAYGKTMMGQGRKKEARMAFNYATKLKNRIKMGK